MCEPQGLGVLGILADIPRTVAGSWKPLAAVAAVAGAVSFAAAYAALLAAAAIVFVAGVGGFALWTRKFRRYEVAPQALVTVTARQGVRAVTAGQRAIGAPKVTVGRVVAVPAEKVVR